MSASDDLLTRASRYADTFDGASLSHVPSTRTAIVTCMDARVDLTRLFGLAPGEVHILRNAGGIVTDDTLRSLVLSQRRLGTRRVMVMQHTDCGLAGLDDDAFADELARKTGSRPSWRAGGFADVGASVAASVRTVSQYPFLPHREDVSGFVLDVASGRMSEIGRDGATLAGGRARTRPAHELPAT